MCNEDLAVMKEYKVRRHYETKHHTLVPNEHRHSSKWGLICKLNNFFFRANKTQESTTTASCEVAKLIAQHGKPFLDGDFIKQCLIKVTEMKCIISAV